MFRSGWDTLPNVRVWSGVPLRCLAVFWRPSRLSGSDRKALPDDQDWYGGIPDVQEWLKGYPECLIVVGRPSRMSGSGRETLQVVRE